LEAHKQAFSIGCRHSLVEFPFVGGWKDGMKKTTKKLRGLKRTASFFTFLFDAPNAHIPYNISYRFTHRYPNTGSDSG